MATAKPKNQIHRIKRNDLEPSIEVILRQDGVVVDLTGCTIRFLMKRGNTLKVSAIAAVVGSPINGRVRYDWVLGDTDVNGTYRMEWEVTKPNTKLITFPTEGYGTVYVFEDLGP